DGRSITFLTVPIFVPVVQALGFDLIGIGIVHGNGGRDQPQKANQRAQRVRQISMLPEVRFNLPRLME
ncbi:MAG: hypothetical protein VYE18_06470, partial [Pseudomonadota bacterium]|nr:hypothetical protein [Pseudomonadota bacterium]